MIFDKNTAVFLALPPNFRTTRVTSHKTVCFTFPKTYDQINDLKSYKHSSCVELKQYCEDLNYTAEVVATKLLKEVFWRLLRNTTLLSRSRNTLVLKHTRVSLAISQFGVSIGEISVRVL